MAVMACKLSPFAPLDYRDSDMFACRELLVRNGSATSVLVSMDEAARLLDIIVFGPPDEVVSFAPPILAEVKTTIFLSRWGIWDEGALLPDLVLCSHCLHEGKRFEAVTVVAVNDEVRRTDVYQCVTKPCSFLRTQPPKPPNEGKAGTSPEPQNVKGWSREQCRLWMLSLNAGFWRYVEKAQLSGLRLLTNDADSWRQSFGVLVDDHLQQLEAGQRDLRLAQEEWQSATRKQRQEKGWLIHLVPC